MNYELSPSILSWPLFLKPERMQVMLAILLSREEDGSLPLDITDRLPMMTGLSRVTIVRSLQELIDAGVLMCVSGRGIPVQIIVANLPDGISKQSYAPEPERKEAEKDSAVTKDESVVPKIQKPASRFVKPGCDELAAYITEKGYSFSAEAFLDYYDSVGWMVGPGKHMKDWKAACRTWNNRRSSCYSKEPQQKISAYEQSRQNSRDIYLAAEAGGAVSTPDTGLLNIPDESACQGTA